MNARICYAHVSLVCVLFMRGRQVRLRVPLAWQWSLSCTAGDPKAGRSREQCLTLRLLKMLGREGEG